MKFWGEINFNRIIFMTLEYRSTTNKFLLLVCFFKFSNNTIVTKSYRNLSIYIKIKIAFKYLTTFSLIQSLIRSH
jgi:hypothetical protein